MCTIGGVIVLKKLQKGTMFAALCHLCREEKAPIFLGVSSLLWNEYFQTQCLVSLELTRASEKGGKNGITTDRTSKWVMVQSKPKMEETAANLLYSCL